MLNLKTKNMGNITEMSITIKNNPADRNQILFSMHDNSGEPCPRLNISGHIVDSETVKIESSVSCSSALRPSIPDEDFKRLEGLAEQMILYWNLIYQKT